MRVAVTGATGFVGTALCPRLRSAGLAVRALVRRAPAPPSAPEFDETVVLGDIETAPPSALVEALKGCDAVVHLAAKVHVMNPTPADEVDFRAANVTATRRLAEAAVAAGVPRFVFLSTIKVNGEATGPGAVFRPDDAPGPEDLYARSKAEAEEALLAVHRLAEPVVLRPPLVYGPCVKGNMRALARLALKPFPLPLGLVRNRRSLVGLANLCSALEHLTVAPGDAVARRVFLVSDGRDLSTGELVGLMRRAVGRSPRLLPVPPALLRAALAASGRGAMADRLLGDLCVDASALRATGWTPPASVEEELARLMAAETGGSDRDT
ncbi:UDP-glucose 4-epimerase [Caenispirillum salinarum AK4]|uniref:UDP-glucose 4-epimerase n=1 Tax=Caenispirillum salinarum AK4 TaxID=1238182 RepID=K9HC10_9PROT|nr:NAD-dependent epimerase/dehydratase family protein [Caenispirillum salinarum]EKV26316.1 UDP-glucose 4-epimerase [Caenispirillum salinarum AK4]